MSVQILRLLAIALGVGLIMIGIMLCATILLIGIGRRLIEDGRDLILNRHPVRWQARAGLARTLARGPRKPLRQAKKPGLPKT